MRNERGSSDGDFFWIFLWIIIVLEVLVPAFNSEYQNKSQCLDEWTACERVEVFLGNAWVPTDEAREK